MKTYYSVTTACYDNGYATVDITSTVEALEKPKATEISTSIKDIYVDWFDTLEAAEKFVLECKQA